MVHAQTSKGKYIIPSKIPYDTTAHAHQTHSPFFIIWEIIGLGCVFFLTLSFLYTQFFNVEERALHLIELADVAAEIILIAEVLLIFLVARNKIHFIKTKWATILAVTPIGGAFRAVRVVKLVWHGLEKTKLAQFLEHPIRGTKKWIRKRLQIR